MPKPATETLEREALCPTCGRVHTVRAKVAVILLDGEGERPEWERRLEAEARELAAACPHREAAP